MTFSGSDDTERFLARMRREIERQDAELCEALSDADVDSKWFASLRARRAQPVQSMAVYGALRA